MFLDAGVSALSIDIPLKIFARIGIPDRLQHLGSIKQKSYLKIAYAKAKQIESRNPYASVHPNLDHSPAPQRCKLLYVCFGNRRTYSTFVLELTPSILPKLGFSVTLSVE